MEQEDIDFDYTFSLVIKATTMHILLSIVVTCGWPIKNVFLYGILNEEVLRYIHRVLRILVILLMFVSCTIQFMVYDRLDMLGSKGLAMHFLLLDLYVVEPAHLCSYGVPLLKSL